MAKLKIKQMEGIIEAILFTMGDSVEIGKIARALEQDEETTRKVIPPIRFYAAVFSYFSTPGIFR